MTKVTAITCPNCNDTIYSRARHDHHYCSCGAVCIDGGYDYVKIGWDPKIERPSLFVLKVEATSRQLHNDWAKKINKYGTVKLNGESND